MKTATLLLALFLFASAQAQSLEVHDMNGNNVTGTTQSYATISSMFTVAYYIVNVSNSSKSVLACRHEISLQPGAADAFLWNNISYAPNVDSATIAGTIAAHDSMYFEGYYFPGSSTGTSTVQYCFWDVNNTTDQSCFTQDYTQQVAGVQELPGEKISFYPQPSDGKVFFDLPGNNGTVDVKLTDESGRTTEIKLPEENNSEYELDEDGLAAGGYFMLVYQNGKFIGSGELVIAKN